jgi:hypothetical protein
MTAGMKHHESCDGASLCSHGGERTRSDRFKTSLFGHGTSTFRHATHKPFDPADKYEITRHRRALRVFADALGSARNGMRNQRGVMASQRDVTAIERDVVWDERGCARSERDVIPSFGPHVASRRDRGIIAPRRSGSVSDRSPSPSRAAAMTAGGAATEGGRCGVAGRTSTSASGPRRLKNRHAALDDRDAGLQKCCDRRDIGGAKLKLRAGRVEIGCAKVGHRLANLENDAGKRRIGAGFSAFW